MKAILLGLLMPLIAVPLPAQVIPQPLDLTGCSCFVTAFDIVSNDVVWVATEKSNLGASKVYGKTIDGGTTWTTANFPSNYRVIGITAIDDQNAWFALQPGLGGGEVWHTADGGTNWTKQTTTEYSGGGFLNQVHFFSLTDGVTLGDQKGGYWEIYTTSDGGVNWARVASDHIAAGLANEGAHPNFTAVGDHIWFGTNRGRVYHSADKGQTWTVKTVSGIEVIPYFNDELNGVATSIFSNNPVYRTTDGGLTWTSKSLGSDFTIQGSSAIQGSNGNYVFVGNKTGEESKLYFTTDNFETYNVLDDSQIFGSWLSFADGLNGWITNPNLGSAHGIYKYESGFPLATENEVKSVSQKMDVTLNPNPASGFTQVNVSSSTYGPLYISIADVTGSVVYRESYQPINLSGHFRLDLGKLMPGLYFITIQNGKDSNQQRLIVQ